MNSPFDLPAGPIRLFMPFFQNRHWTVFGGVSPEDRWTGVIDEMSEHKVPYTAKMISIQPERAIVHSWTDEYVHRLSSAETIAGGRGLAVSPMTLTASTETLVRTFDGILDDSTDSLLIDLSVLPKRFFFPFLRRLLSKDQVFKNLVVAYTAAESYASDQLATATEPVAPLPLFRSAETDERLRLFIAAGYEPYSLPDFPETRKLENEVHVLFPFPPGPPHFFRCNEFVRLIEQSILGLEMRVVVKEIAAHDVGGQLSYLGAATKSGSIPALLAPYGPKTVSLAMALHALAYRREVVYSQPRVYNPNYSSGTGMTEGRRNISVFGIKLDSEVRVKEWKIALERL